LRVVWDTGSEILLAAVDYCSNCDPATTLFDSTASSSYTVLTGGDYDYEFTQGYADGTALTGEWVTDDACFIDDATSCVSTYEWVAVYDQDGLGTTIDGIIGL